MNAESQNSQPQEGEQPCPSLITPAESNAADCVPSATAANASEDAHKAERRALDERDKAIRQRNEQNHRDSVLIEQLREIGMRAEIERDEARAQRNREMWQRSDKLVSLRSQLAASEAVVTAARDMSRKRACIIFAEAPEHVADFFKDLDIALSALDRTEGK